MIYSKGETVFGIDRAARLRDADYYIIVEGAPDVLRMQLIGYDNTVASLGTAWSDSQFEQLKKYVSSLCFIPDSDIAEGKPYGPGFEAVMTNGLQHKKDPCNSQGTSFCRNSIRNRRRNPICQE